jgi:endo-beta-N-acetylglucosaminidase D
MISDPYENRIGTYPGADPGRDSPALDHEKNVYNFFFFAFDYWQFINQTLRPTSSMNLTVLLSSSADVYNKLATIAKKIAQNILWMPFTFISYLKIIQQAVKHPHASHNNSISFCTKIVPSGLACNCISEHLD